MIWEGRLRLGRRAQAEDLISLRYAHSQEEIAMTSGSILPVSVLASQPSAEDGGVFK